MIINQESVNVKIWDSAGQERYKTISKSQMQAAHGILLVYSITDEKSFNDMEYWLAQVDANSKVFTTKLIVAAKCDLADQRIIKEEAGKALAERYNCRFFETSSKTCYNVDNVFNN